MSACNAEDLGWIPGSGRSPGEGNGNPLQYSCLDQGFSLDTCPEVRLLNYFMAVKPKPKHHGRRSLVSYSPQGRKELDTAE